MKRIYNQLIKTSLMVVLMCSTASSPAADFQLPPYQQMTLANGLTLYLMEQHEVPLININVVINTGAIDDGDKAGLASLTIENLVLGSEKQTKQQIEQAFDFIGAQLNADSGLERTTLEASFAQQDQQQVLTILRDLLLQPRFDPAEFEKHRSRYLSQLIQQKESAKSVISQYFRRHLFSESGYGHAPQGDTDSIAAITIADLKQFYQRGYQPNNTAIVVVGDFASQAMLAQLKTLFAPWTASPLATAPTAGARAVPVTRAQAMPKKHQSTVLLVDNPNATETTFMIGGPGVARNNPDYIEITVVNTILGARFTSWLNDALRVTSGLTYGARSSFSSYRDAGIFSISTYTKTENSEQAIDLALATYQKLWPQTAAKGALDEATLASAKAYVKGQFPPKYETSGQLAGLLADMYSYGFDQSYINNFSQKVNALTVESANQIIKQYFPKDNLQFVLIGKADEIRTMAKKYGEVSEKKLNAVGF